MDLQLEGLRAIVTGGTGGLGRAAAEALADEGCHVAVCARGEEGVEEAVSSLESRGVTAFGRALDVTHEEDLRAWVAAAGEALGGIDIVVANVSALALGAGDDAWRRSFEVDLMHSVRTVDAALPRLRESDSGSVVVVSSVSARHPMSVGPYGAVKAALNHYGKSLAVELAPEGIRANVLSPGTIYVEDGFWGGVERENPEMFEQALGSNPMGRMGRPDEVGRAVAFLASPAASFISGTNLLVDGALTPAVQM